MALVPATAEQRKNVKEDIKLNESQLEQKIKQVKEWMKKQPHLPEVPDDIAEKMITAFLFGTKLSTEKTKIKIDTYYAMRHQIPEVFQNRDPTQQDIRDSVDVIRFFPLSELTPEGFRVNILSYSTDKDNKFTAQDMKALYKRVMAITDARMQQDDYCCGGDYIVFDCLGFYMSHMTEMPWMLVQKLTAFIQTGLPIRVKGVFVINAPGFIEAAVNILKPVLKEKIKKRIQIFHGDHTKLYKFIPQRILPSDFGGEAPSIEESSRAWQKTIESMRDFLIEDGKRLTDESKRPRDSVNDCGQLFGINGTFNKLNID